MQGILLYKKEDVERNRVFIQKFTDHSRSYSIRIALWIYEEVTVSGGTCFINGRLVATPDFVVNRSREYDRAEEMESMGIRVFNHAGVSRLCNDKDLTLRWAERLGVPIMDYRIFREADLSQYEYPCVLKSCAGHGGKEVFLCHLPEELERSAQLLGGKKCIVQRVADNGGADLRIYVMGGRIVTAMLRKAHTGLISNYTIHGNASEAVPDERCRCLVRKILAAIDFDFAGIDLLFHRGMPVLNEIEDAVGSRMIYENTDIDIIQKYVDYLYRELIRKDRKPFQLF